LKAGDRLQTDALVVVTVAAVRNYTASMVTYDLTIDGLHTYFVVAGDTSVLVHNTSDCELYPNLYDPEAIQEELARAASLGIKPMTVGSEAFNDAVSAGGRYIWGVNADGELRIAKDIPRDITHSVLFDGAELRGAGEVTFTDGQVSLINDKSGHYFPWLEDPPGFLGAGVDAFRAAGVAVPGSAIAEVGGWR
jgi:hypothetical protein